MRHAPAEHSRIITGSRLRRIQCAGEVEVLCKRLIQLTSKYKCTAPLPALPLKHPKQPRGRWYQLHLRDKEACPPV